MILTRAIISEFMTNVRATVPDDARRGLVISELNTIEQELNIIHVGDVFSNALFLKHLKVDCSDVARYYCLRYMNENKLAENEKEKV